MSPVVLSANSQAGSFTIANSLRFRASASAYLNRTPASAGNRQTWTWSGWVKRGTLGTDQYVFGVRNGISDTDSLYLAFYSNNTFVISSNSTPIPYLVTSQLFRDPSAWYHIVVAVDTTQATSTNRIKVYVNGAQITSFSTATYPSQNANLGINQAYQHVIGAWYNGSSYIVPFDGYLTEINFIDGQALTPSSFGEIDSTTGVWKAKRYTGTYGTNGFKLNFSNGTSTTTLGYDSSGNGNNWTTNNISLTAGSTYDWMIDSPTPFQGSSYGVGNYAVLNPINIGSASSLNSGNLNFTSSSASGFWYQSIILSNFAVRSGKWYWEQSLVTTGGTYGISAGVANPALSTSFGTGLSPSYGYYGFDGSKNNNGTISAYGASWGVGDIIGVALDLDAGQITYYKNGVSQGVAATGISGTFTPITISYESGRTHTGWFNFGQRPFAYTPPSGYKSLCTQNLPGVTIQNGAQYMAATLYTGNGATQSISNAVNGVSFQPDFVWTKTRSTVQNHAVYDVVRGTQQRLLPNLTNAEDTVPGVTSFNSSGFSVGANIASNESGSSFVAWQWKAGGTAVTNTAGSITSSVSANTTSGFSVVTYTGTNSNATVGHGLGVAPSMIINKSRNSAGQNWHVFHAGLANMTTAYVRLNTTDAAGTLGNAVATPTSTTFGISASIADTSTYVAYCFAAIPGYSAFGSYTGNGSTDGPFVYLGFRPRFILTKMTNTSGNYWIIHDTARDPYNAATQRLYPNVSDAEAAATDYDILSNGFKLRTTAEPNGSGNTFIYAAFAENPFQNALAR